MSEGAETLIEAGEDGSKWPLPYNIGIDKLDMIVKSFFQAEADKKSVSLTELPGRTGIHIRTIRGNMKFLQALGILRLEGKDAFFLEEKGAIYAKSLGAGDTQGASKILNELIRITYLKELVDFIELRKTSKERVNFELLFSHIKTNARLKEDPKYPRGIAAPYSAGITTLIDLLIRAGIAPDEIKGEKDVVPKGIPSKRAVLKIEKKPLDGLSINKDTRTQGNTLFPPVTININIEAKDAESIKNLQKLLKILRGETIEE